MIDPDPDVRAEPSPDRSELLALAREPNDAEAAVVGDVDGAIRRHFEVSADGGALPGPPGGEARSLVEARDPAVRAGDVEIALRVDTDPPRLAHADCLLEASTRTQLLDAVVRVVGDEHAAVRANGDVVRVCELAVPDAERSELVHEPALGGEHLDAVVPRIRGVDVPVLAHCEPGDVVAELAVGLPDLPPLADLLEALSGRRGTCHQRRPDEDRSEDRP